MKAEQRLRIGEDVAHALEEQTPIVGLETAVVTHGLPEPDNRHAIATMMAAVRGRGTVPATCVMLDGSVWVGATQEQIERVAAMPDRVKITVAELGIAAAKGQSGGLTVSATLAVLHAAGVRVFATGGIGGVHLDAAETWDVSADLHQLARTPIVTVCSGVKSVLDIPRTVEYLETLGVPVVAYRSNTLPAFYLASSTAHVPRVDSVAEIAGIARSQWTLGSSAGLIVTQPAPGEGIAPDEWDVWLTTARKETRPVRGKDVTPALLDRVAELSDGATVRINVALLRNNALLAAEIAAALSS